MSQDEANKLAVAVKPGPAREAGLERCVDLSRTGGLLSLIFISSGSMCLMSQDPETSDKRGNSICCDCLLN